MVPPLSRRRLLALGAGTLTGVAGCQAPVSFDSGVDIEIHVLNVADERLDVWVQLTSAEGEVGDQLGESFPLEPGGVERLDATVPAATYRLRVALNDDDVDRRTRWEVTDQDCAKRSYATFVAADPGVDLRLRAANCEDT